MEHKEKTTRPAKKTSPPKRTKDNPTQVDKIVNVKSVKVVDPSITFTLYTEDEGPFNCYMEVLVVVIIGTNTTTSLVSIQNEIVANTLDFQVPFADPDFKNQLFFPYTLSVTLKDSLTSAPGFAPTAPLIFSGVYEKEPA